LLTVISEHVKGDDACCEVDEVEEEMTVVVDANAVVDPRAMAGGGLLAIRTLPHHFA